MTSEPLDTGQTPIEQKKRIQKVIHNEQIYQNELPSVIFHLQTRAEQFITHDLHMETKAATIEKAMKAFEHLKKITKKERRVDKNEN